MTETRDLSLFVRLDADGPRQRQRHLRSRIETLAVFNVDSRPNAGTLKNTEHLGVREKPQLPGYLELYFESIVSFKAAMHISP